MFLFVFEFLGTSELILIGVVALIFLGPRKLPEIARKAGKIMSEFRGTANEFKQTWEREIDFEEEKKAFSLASLDEDAVAPDAPAEPASTTTLQEPPVVRTADPDMFRDMIPAQNETAAAPDIKEPAVDAAPDVNDKQNWL